MKKSLIALFLMTSLFGSCAPAPASPTQPQTTPVIRTIIPSQTPHPTEPAIPTATPYPPLQTKGPYLLYSNGYNSLTIMDADGTGREQFKLPTGGRLGWYFENTVSPDGNWIAYYTGSEKEPYDLALHLFSTTHHTSQLISNLIAPGFPDNLAPVTKTMYFTEYDTECANDLNCQLSQVQSAFTQSIGNGNAVDWSPDSKFLAFAAQIDGPSSDIYIFDTENNSIRRLTDDLENIWHIDWSPDGRKILYENSIPGGNYLSRFLHIADPNIKSSQHPKAIDGGPFWFEYGWIDQNSYLIYSGGEGAPPHRLRIINTEAQDVKEIWKYSAESFFVDLRKRIIILSPYGRIYLQSEPEIEVYIVSFDGDYHKVSNEFVYFIDGQDAVNQYFASDQQHQLVSVKLDGSITHLARRADYYVPPRSSPDGKWIIITSETET
ncbi:MAG: hypothetical protein ABIU06_13995 [Anaerolineales bacterium]